MTAKKTREEFIEQSKDIHGDKYDYSSVNYINTNTKVTIQCNIHGTFLQAPSMHIKGQGCKQCGIANHPKKDDTQSFTKKARKKHNNKYDYSRVNYVSSGENVTIVCDIHGPFQMKPILHMRGQGCRQCGITKRAHGNKKDLQYFVSRSKQIHGDKYDYSESVYTGAHSDITIRCKQHGDFTLKAGTHTNNGIGCSKCSVKSKGEQQVMHFLDNNNIKYQREYEFEHLIDKKHLRYDFFLTKLNMLIEYDGKQHFEFTPRFHKSVEDFNLIKLHDSMKNRFAEQHDIPLIRIHHRDADNIETILSEHILQGA